MIQKNSEVTELYTGSEVSNYRSPDSEGFLCVTFNGQVIEGIDEDLNLMAGKKEGRGVTRGAWCVVLREWSYAGA